MSSRDILALTRVQACFFCSEPTYEGDLRPVPTEGFPAGYICKGCHENCSEEKGLVQCPGCGFWIWKKEGHDTGRGIYCRDCTAYGAELRLT